MDLRPKLADDFITAILEDLAPHLDLEPEEQTFMRERWKKLILDRFVGHSIPFTDGNWVSTDDDEVAEAFIAKYPHIRALVAMYGFTG